MPKSRPSPFGLIPLAYTRLRGDSLYRNSFFLLTNMAITSATGFLFWTLCAHLYSQTEVGYATAALAAVNLAVSFSNIGLSRTVVRFFHKADSREGFLAATLTITLVTASLIAFVMSFFLRRFGLKDPNVLFVFLFIVAIITASLKNIFDNVFVALRAASSTLAANVVFNVAKLVVPLAVVSFGYIGIFSAQLVGLLLAVSLSFILAHNVHSLRSKVTFKLSPLAGKWQFALGNYVSDIVGSLPNNALPLIIVSKVGPAAGATWYVVLQIANVLFLICATINQSLFAEASADEDKLMSYIKKTSAMMIAIVLPLALFLVIFANFILGIFGHEYQAGKTVLYLLVASSLLVMFNYIFGSVLTIYKKIRYMLLVNIANAIVVIGLSFWFAHSLVSIGMIWIAGEFVNVLCFGAGAVYFHSQQVRVHV